MLVAPEEELAQCISKEHHNQHGTETEDESVDPQDITQIVSLHADKVVDGESGLDHRLAEVETHLNLCRYVEPRRVQERKNRL